MQVMVENQVLLSQNLNCKNNLFFKSLNINSTNQIRKRPSVHTNIILHTLKYIILDISITQYWRSHASNHLEVTFWHTSAFFITFLHSLLRWHFANILKGWPVGLEQRNGLCGIPLSESLPPPWRLALLSLHTFQAPPLHRISLRIFFLNLTLHFKNRFTTVRNVQALPWGLSQGLLQTAFKIRECMF